MITKALVEEVVDQYSVRVRIPVIHKSAQSASCTPFNELPIATICAPPETTYTYAVGDVVYVAYEDNQSSKLVVLGRLSRKFEDKSISNIHSTIDGGTFDNKNAEILIRGDHKNPKDNELSPRELGMNIDTDSVFVGTQSGRVKQLATVDYVESEWNAKQDALTAGDNIEITSNVIRTKAFPCNPNLLDNWYFGNPVDQRSGYVVKPGVNYYTTDWVIAGQTDKYYPVSVLTDGAVVFQIDGTTYYSGVDAVVRGYTGIRYGIDRWKMWQAGGTVTIENGGIVIRKSSGEYVQWGEMLDADVWGALVGQQVTMSALTVNGQLATTTQTFTEAGILQVAAFDGLTFHSTVTLHFIDFVLAGAESPAILAVKLELGSQQTLAHQENGVWVLNEIPDYGEQLRRCQRYYYHGDRLAVTQKYGAACVPFPVQMRVTPVVTVAVNATQVAPGVTMNTYVSLNEVVVTGLIADTGVNITVSATADL